MRVLEYWWVEVNDLTRRHNRSPGAEHVNKALSV